MLALSLLLCAAGVKAMLGIRVSAIQLKDGRIVCSDNCAIDEAYLADDGSVCGPQEVVVQLDNNGNEQFYPKYVCAEAASTQPGWSTRPRKNGEEPDNCPPKELDKSSPIDAQCASTRMDNSNGKVEVRQLEQLAEVKKMLGLSASQEVQGCTQATNGSATTKVPRRVSF